MGSSPEYGLIPCIWAHPLIEWVYIRGTTTRCPEWLLKIRCMYLAQASLSDPGYARKMGLIFSLYARSGDELFS